MNETDTDGFRERVRAAAEAALKAEGAVGPLELLQRMQFLQPAHVIQWREGIPDARSERRKRLLSTRLGEAAVVWDARPQGERSKQKRLDWPQGPMFVTNTRATTNC